MALMRLTQKREGFVKDVFKGNTLAQAYRNNFSTENMAEKTIWEASSRLMADSKVSARLKKMQRASAERAQVTVESLTIELEQARKVSMDEGQGAAMTGATMGKAKLHGLLVEKTESKVEVTHDLDSAAEALSAMLTARNARK